jgi:hypothetical protein
MPGFKITGKEISDPLMPPGNIEPLRAYRWALESMGAYLTTTQLAVVAELDVPSFEFEEQIVLGMSAEYKFAKRPKFGDIEIQFYDDGNLQQAFEEWMAKIWTPEKGLTGDAYKTMIKFSELDNTGNAVGTFVLYEAWPKTMSHTKLSYSDNNLKRLNVKFSYHFYKYTQIAPQRPRTSQAQQNDAMRVFDGT